MFQKMRRSDRKLTETESKTILANGEYGILSTIGKDGYPYGIPVNYVYMDDEIYFHCASGIGLKLKNINYSAQICFTVVGITNVIPKEFSTKYESVIVFGLASEVTDNKQLVLEALIQKYAPEYKEDGLKYINQSIDKTAIYKIKIEHITGKARK
jgi:nitroimidazol reductase NimA-like FMN-containing flavoprotein (pyridoxamine 5'-phosphate oxidase superfamily)